MTDALAVEATRKAGVVWIATATERPRPAWFVWQDDPGALYLVTGPAEQPLPGLAEAATCEVTVPSNDKGGRIITYAGTVSRVSPGTEEWDLVVPGLVGKRLNVPDLDTAADRWAATCAVLRITPGDRLPMPTDSLAAPPVPTPATTPARIPYTLGRRRKSR